VVHSNPGGSFDGAAHAREEAMRQLQKVDREIIQDTVRRNLRQRRERSQLTQGDVAQLIGVKLQELAHAESGDGPVDADLLYLLSEHYRCDVNDFYLGIFDYKRPTRSAGSENAESLLVKSMVADFSAIENPELRFAIMNMINGVAGFSKFLEMQGYAFRQI
jgi:transcriptional regulator with XRE-family HTH domain